MSNMLRPGSTRVMFLGALLCLAVLVGVRRGRSGSDELSLATRLDADVRLAAEGRLAQKQASLASLRDITAGEGTGALNDAAMQHFAAVAAAQAGAGLHMAQEQRRVGKAIVVMKIMEKALGISNPAMLAGMPKAVQNLVMQSATAIASEHTPTSMPTGARSAPEYQAERYPMMQGGDPEEAADPGAEDSSQQDAPPASEKAGGAPAAQPGDQPHRPMSVQPKVGHGGWGHTAEFGLVRSHPRMDAQLETNDKKALAVLIWIAVGTLALALVGGVALGCGKLLTPPGKAAGKAGSVPFAPQAGGGGEGTPRSGKALWGVAKQDMHHAAHPMDHSAHPGVHSAPEAEAEEEAVSIASIMLQGVQSVLQVRHQPYPPNSEIQTPHPKP
jgi:hypothetical protein